MRFNFKNTSGIQQADVARVGKRLAKYISRLQEASCDTAYACPESSLYLPHHHALRKQVKKMASLLASGRTREVFVVGIGGSNLGTLAVYEAIMPKGIALSFFDTVYGKHVAEGVDRMKQIFKGHGEVIVNIVSKSGTTNEPVAIGHIMINVLKKIRRKDWNRFVVVTTEPGSKLDLWAAAHDIQSLPNPPSVGGRYSVMSAVGLFPLYLSGVDIDELHKGAREALTQCLNPNPSVNPALQSATALYYAMKAGYSMENLFVFNPDLERVGKWYRQLLAESLGKERDTNDVVVHAGIMPIVSVGSVDLHSTTQLYLGGPRNKFTTFMWLPSARDIRIPNVDAGFNGLVSEIKNQTLNQVMEAIYEGTKGSYRRRKLPYAEIVLKEQNEREIGAFLQFKMVQTMLLGALMKVNAFDQPNVEEYKNITKRLLARL